jgi:flagellar biosynthesis/type III secretory pathway M-ring protein FliF/YscJ
MSIPAWLVVDAVLVGLVLVIIVRAIVRERRQR